MIIEETAEQLSKLIDNRINEIYTALTGKVIAVYNEDSLVDVQPYGAVYDEYGNISSLPRVFSVPVLYPGRDDMKIVFPLRKGDMCLLIVNMVDNEYWQGGTTSPLRHQLNEAVAIPFSFSAGGSDAVSDVLTLRNGETGIKISKDSITFELPEGESND